MKDAQQTREQVSATYATAIRATGGCCGPAPGAASKKIYDATDIVGLEAVPSFGCGNPLAFSEVQPGQTVVDLGSGAGLDLLVAAHKVGPTGRVIGVDMTDAMIDAARANIAEAGADNVEVRKGIIEELPVSDASVDWVISNCVINLSPEKPRVFAEIARVLRAGGTMLVSDIVADDLPEWIRTNPLAISACVGGAVSEAEYLAGLREAGLDDIAVVERHTYTFDELVGFLSSDFPGLTEQLQGPLRAQLEQAVAGKVHSLRIRARKPA